MKFTIEEINQAWIEFNRPKWIADKREFDPEQVEQGIINVDNLQSVQQVYRTDFISWLVSWKTNKRQKKVTKK